MNLITNHSNRKTFVFCRYSLFRGLNNKKQESIDVTVKNVYDATNQPAFTCSKSTMEAIEKYLKSAQN